MDEFLFLDLESRSVLNLLKVGSYVYWEHPSTEVMCAAWAIGDGPIQLWLPGQPCPAEIFDHVTSGGMVSGWNVGGFERIAWRACLGPIHGWPVPVLEQYDDTAAMAAAMALPRALEDIGPALRMDIKKDAAGRKIMLEMCKPRRFHKGDLPGVPYWYDDEIRHKQLRAYCKRDVEVERAVRKRLIPLSEGERAIWLLDMIINDRGVQIDLDLVRSMELIVKQEKKRLDRAMSNITGGAITATSQVQALTEWLREQGAVIANLDKRGLEAILADPELPIDCSHAITVRREAAKASTAKLQSAQVCSCSDGRSRGLMLYHGASTGRWCLAEGSMVLTRTGEKPIETVTTVDEVWDGEAWVRHDGVVFSGNKVVIQHDGVVATPEHIVYLDTNRRISLGEAKRLGLRLWRGATHVFDLQTDGTIGPILYRHNQPNPRAALVFSCAQSLEGRSELSAPQQHSQIWTGIVRTGRAGGIRGRGRGLAGGSVLYPPHAGEDQGLQYLGRWGIRLAGGHRKTGQAKIGPEIRSGLPGKIERGVSCQRSASESRLEIRRSDASVARRECAYGLQNVLSRYAYGTASARYSARRAARSTLHQVWREALDGIAESDKCQSQLRAGGSHTRAVGNHARSTEEASASADQRIHEAASCAEITGRACRARRATRRGAQEHQSGSSQGAAKGGANSLLDPGATGGEDRRAESTLDTGTSVGAEQSHADSKIKTPTYDILNAGPRNRFMANGRIVSNSGKLLQPHNFVRGSGDKQVPVLMQGDATLVDLIHGNPLAVLAKSMRAIICAPKGKRFVAADFSQIEARVTAWIAGQEDTLEMFRVYDRGEGPGIYEVSASGIYGCPVKDIDEEDPRRQTGKTATLACGFGGGVSALAKMAANYAIDMATAFPGLWATTDEATRERAMKRYEECLARSDSSADVLTEMAWLACELTKIGWRAANPKIVSSWKALDNAAIEAVLHPGTQVQAVHVDHDGHPTELLPVTFRTAFGYLWMRLPSGRCLAYPAPRCEMVTVPWADLTQPLDKREKRLAVTVLGVGQNNQFVRYALYPGLTVQHAVQATARDLMAAGMLRAEAHGYPIVLTVHDEVLAEMAHGEGDLEEFKRLLCVPQQWTTGLPIAASGWEGPRFRK